MPGTYPAAPPTLSNDLLTISRFLENPTNLRRRLRTFRDLRFISDQILTQRFVSQGGAVLYELSEPMETNRPVEAVGPGSEYPKASVDNGTAGLASVSKWGQATDLTDEEVKRHVYGGELVDRKLRKVVNTVIHQVDNVTMSAINSAVTADFDVVADGGGAWDGATPKILRDILMAKAEVVGLNQGYLPDILVVNDLQYAILMSDEKITNALQRETSTSPVYTGEIERVAGLTILTSPTITDPLVADSQQLGGMADETQVSPGYAIGDLAVETKAIRIEKRDMWELQGRRLTVPVVQEPGAGITLSNTTS
jgi:hypothetical protein